MAYNDPRWITAKFSSKCQCGTTIRKGGRCFYYPRSRRAVCETCGQQGERDLRAEISYERYGNDCAMDF